MDKLTLKCPQTIQLQNVGKKISALRAPIASADWQAIQYICAGEDRESWPSAGQFAFPATLDSATHPFQQALRRIS
jgi:hypothetical protein